ncbi:capsule polysaccharide transporter [Allofrancisella inopinata]|nr:capsule polysaccharide transporter [Allofrancisella inopinata]
MSLQNIIIGLKLLKMLYSYRYYINNFLQLFYKSKFAGWGRKKTGRLALWCYRRFGGSVRLLEDGFIRSIGLGIDNSPSFSLVEDDVGIYYDATTPSKLENILNSYDFAQDKDLMLKAQNAISLLKKHNISKYNNAQDVDKDFCKKYGLGYRDSRSESGMMEKVSASMNEIPGSSPKMTACSGNDVEILNQVQDDILHKKKNILIIAQTAGDSSLEYGLANQFSTDDMIEAAIAENPDAKIYLKIHPDVLSGKKASDIDIHNIDSRVTIISENINPVSLLKYFDKVYTKTSGMGFEALLVGCECVCFGMPYYAGWGITDDRILCERRKRKLSVEEVFAAAYILYTRYVNPYTKKEIDIIETIQTIVKLRNS